MELTWKTEQLKASLSQYNSYTSSWERAYFDEHNGWYLVIDRERIKHSKVSKNEKAKFDKEYAMSMVFAQNGYRIEMLKELPRIPSPDVTINGMKADLKHVSSHNNVVRHAKKAVRKQGAEIVLFEFENNTKKIQEELDKLKIDEIKVYYYFTGNESKIHIL
ncbi:MAG: hypothetical protein LBK97_02065 [Prevotellaceae bacterium]|jgi:hypothetical protein|nr:hypothetical protein [Prevotellaceae bacterium]